MPEPDLDVAVIGGGPAGLAAALALVRSRKRVGLYDCWPPRNAAATEVRGFVTQDGTPPEEMRRIARAQLADYPTFQLREGDRVRRLHGARGRFVVENDGGTATARRVLLCLGLVDVLPDLPGYRELWGHAVFQCPHCHAWEVRDRRFGYLAPDAGCVDWAIQLRGWTEDLVVFTSRRFAIGDALAAELATANIAVETRQVIGLEHRDGQLLSVQLEGGATVPRDVLFVRPPQRQTELVSRLVNELGLRLDRFDLIHTDDNFETTVPGIYAAGDLMSAEHGALIAAANGARAAHALDAMLTRERVLGATS